jgi:Lrp/AsnC family transcriptional regulator, leucine-responsive regulatory protein
MSVETVVLDETDFRIINGLVTNGRASFASLGADVGLSPHAVADRVRRLRAAKVIIGFTARVDLRTVGRALDAFVDLRLSSGTDPDEFERAVSKLPAVREVSFVTGPFDYQLRVACVDADDLDHTVRALRRRAGAAHTETRIILRSTAHQRRLQHAD